MEQLTEMDNNFLLQESNRTPMHISPVVIYDQSHRKGGKVRYKEILTVFERNLYKSAIFRRKLAGGALGFDTPYWVEDPDFDLEFHVRHIALPKPGDWRQFCILLARLQARGLDLKKPLWEAYLIEGLNKVQGLPENSFAIMIKIHHAAIDGVSGAEILTAVHSLTDEIEPPVVIDTWKGERDPSPAQIWSRAYMKNLQRPVKFVETVRTLIPAVIRAEKENPQGRGENDPRKPLVEKTRFNGQVTPTRVTDALIMELDDIKAIRRGLDNAVTINDIIVSIVSGGLRKYLAAKGELPEDSLSCGAPINTRSDRNSDSRGNQVDMMLINMATDIEDPIARLRAVQINATQSKDFTNKVGTSMLTNLTEIIVPQVLGWTVHAASAAVVRSDVRMPFHVVISNVPGPQFPMYLAGAKVAMMMGMGPLLDMMGLFHAVISGAGKITINFVSCREMLPDPEFYQECLDNSYQELQSAIKALPGKRKSRAKPAANKKAKPKVKTRAKTTAAVKSGRKAKKSSSAGKKKKSPAKTP